MLNNTSEQEPKNWPEPQFVSVDELTGKELVARIGGELTETNHVQLILLAPQRQGYIFLTPSDPHIVFRYGGKITTFSLKGTEVILREDSVSFVNPPTKDDGKREGLAASGVSISRGLGVIPFKDSGDPWILQAANLATVQFKKRAV